MTDSSDSMSTGELIAEFRRTIGAIPASTKGSNGQGGENPVKVALQQAGVALASLDLRVKALEIRMEGSPGS